MNKKCLFAVVIVDVDISNAVAVNINNEYRKADIKNNDE